jgi:microcin C transport system permease protein
MLTKNSILDQFQQLYAVAARARGLSERKVLFKHVFRNSMIPLVTGFPASFLLMFLSGSLLIEKVFSLNGLGYLSFEAVLNRDFPLIMSNLFVFTIVGLVLRLVTDICYAIVDPRISFDASQY